MSAAIPPAVRWAQRRDRLYLTICLEDIKEKNLELTENKLVFSGTGGTDHSKRAVTIEFYNEVIPQESKQLATDREIVMSIKKKEEGPYWPRLLADKTKRHWLKTDFQRWVGEDESDEENDEAGPPGGPAGMRGQDHNLEEMMAQLGSGFNGAGGLGMDGEGDGLGMQGEEEDDEEEEEMPKLE